MKQISVLVIDPVGLHARPATVAVNAASKFKSEVKVAYKGSSDRDHEIHHGCYVPGHSDTVRSDGNL